MSGPVLKLTKIPKLKEKRSRPKPTRNLSILYKASLKTKWFEFDTSMFSQEVIKKSLTKKVEKIDEYY